MNSEDGQIKNKKYAINILPFKLLYNHPIYIDIYGHPSIHIELCACNERRSAWRAMNVHLQIGGDLSRKSLYNLNRVSSNKHSKYHCVVLWVIHKLRNAIRGRGGWSLRYARSQSLGK